MTDENMSIGLAVPDDSEGRLKISTFYKII